MQMQEHVSRLCEANEIGITYIRRKAYGNYWLREIWIPPVKSPRSYATALHEIGHILGRHQLSKVILVRERWAWNWARRNALRWTPAMQWHAEWCLEYYEHHPYAKLSNTFDEIAGEG
jgi:hypothetical protein